jgi:hypothetical protein
MLRVILQPDCGCNFERSVKIIIQRDTGFFGNVSDIVASDGKGLRFGKDGKSITFL